MRAEVLRVEPRYEELLVPQCVSSLFCPEKHGCGRYPSREEVEEFIEMGRAAKRASNERFIDIDDTWEGDDNYNVID
jgi:hypothetical protein